jgi:hypothetical protein
VLTAFLVTTVLLGTAGLTAGAVLLYLLALRHSRVHWDPRGEPPGIFRCRNCPGTIARCRHGSFEWEHTATRRVRCGRPGAWQDTVAAHP